MNLTFENDFVTRLKKSPTVFALDLVSDIFYWPRKLGGGGGTPRQAGRQAHPRDWFVNPHSPLLLTRINI